MRARVNLYHLEALRAAGTQGEWHSPGMVDSREDADLIVAAVNAIKPMVDRMRELESLLSDICKFAHPDMKTVINKVLEES